MCVPGWNRREKLFSFRGGKAKRGKTFLRLLAIKRLILPIRRLNNTGFFSRVKKD
jgi:hypothetical protein